MIFLNWYLYYPGTQIYNYLYYKMRIEKGRKYREAKRDRHFRMDVLVKVERKNNQNESSWKY